MKTLKGKFLVAAIALSAVSGAFINIKDVDAYKVSKDVADTRVLVWCSGRFR